MKRALPSSIGIFVLILSGGAYAADMSPVVYKASPPPPYSWSGFYLGGHVGYAWGHDSVVGTNLLVPGPATIVAAHTENGPFGGVQAGYDFLVRPRWLVGFKVDVSGGSIQGANGAQNPAGATDRTFSTKVDTFETVRGRIGYVFDRFMVYGSGGASFLRAESTRNQLIGTTNFAPPGTVEKNTFSSVGWAGGLGIEYAIAPHWTVNAEYLYIDFGDGTHIRPLSQILGLEHVRMNTTQLGINYRF